MTLEHCRQAIREAGVPAPAAAPKGSALYACAGEAALMVRSYLGDGDAFLKAGTIRDGLASYAYALGWHDAATSLGLFEGSVLGPEVLLPFLHDLPPDRLLPAKREKYADMLCRALACVFPLPDRASCLYPEAVRVLALVQSSREQGERMSSTGHDTGALVWLSYGYGWLDHGVRAGIIGIDGDRSLFTI
jgi:uncharacterized protein